MVICCILSCGSEQDEVRSLLVLSAVLDSSGHCINLRIYFGFSIGADSFITSDDSDGF